MTALAAARGNRERRIKFLQFLLATGVVAFPGADIFWSPALAAATIGSATPGLKYLGKCVEPISVTGDGTKKINVDLIEEIGLTYMVNGTSTDAIQATDFLSTAYSLDDQTVSILPAGKSPVGVIWDVDAVNGIGIQKTPVPFGSETKPTIAYVFTANVFAPAAIVNNAIYECGATGAASTVTLPAITPDGTECEFVADGTNNNQTVTYQDATGPVALTTALVASKRHGARFAKANGKWRVVGLYVGP